MTTPFSWLGVGLAATPFAMKTVGEMSQSLTQAFGSFLKADEAKVSGHSEDVTAALSSTREQPANNEFTQLASQISDWLKSRGKELGVSVAQLAFRLEVHQDQSLHITGPEPLKSELDAYLAKDPELVQRLRGVAMRQTSPLAWLPGTHAGAMMTMHLPGEDS